MIDSSASTPPPGDSSPSAAQDAAVDYAQLVTFLVEPFLTSADSLRLDSEVSPRTGRILLRLAIEGEDKGKVFGRGGRNLQAIRSVLDVAAQLVGATVHLEVFGLSAEREGNRHGGGRREGNRREGRDRADHPPTPRPRPKPR
ncbi:MAG: KH domain-containing protein [Cyanobacteria bacterium P01_A01_bin.135]